jgi:hypothetical protein
MDEWKTETKNVWINEGIRVRVRQKDRNIRNLTATQFMCPCYTCLYSNVVNNILSEPNIFDCDGDNRLRLPLALWL